MLHQMWNSSMGLWCAHDRVTDSTISGCTTTELHSAAAVYEKEQCKGYILSWIKGLA